MFDEMLLTLVEGGYAIFTSREEYMSKYGYQNRIDQLASEGKWKFIESESYTKYDKLEKEVGRFKPTVSMVFVYQKL